MRCDHEIPKAPASNEDNRELIAVLFLTALLAFALA
jgi:hypothetical protein